MMRRAAAIAAGLAMATTFGLAGAGMASAASPGLKIKPNAIWTLEVKNGPCDEVQFNGPTTFVGVHTSEVGTWSGGGSKISMVWPGDVTFHGHFVSTTKPVEYKGSLSVGAATVKAKVVKGAVAGC